MIVGIAYVVRRPRGRFEIRESVVTPGGPRARSLANFAVLTNAVLEAGEGRARGPFDRARVMASARRAGAPVELSPRGGETDYGSFVAASRRLGRALDRPGPLDRARDPGEALIDLLAFTDAVTAASAARPVEPLRFPPLRELMAPGGRQE